MKILALDAATMTGWAQGELRILGQNYAICLLGSGVKRVSVAKDEPPALRFQSFRTWVYGLAKGYDLLAYEEPHLRGRKPTRFLVGLANGIEEVGGGLKIPVVSVHSGTLKKFATGSGRASKEDMIAAARKRWQVEPKTDDEADALMILAWAIERSRHG